MRRGRIGATGQAAAGTIVGKMQTHTFKKCSATIPNKTKCVSCYRKMYFLPFLTSQLIKNSEQWLSSEEQEASMYYFQNLMNLCNWVPHLIPASLPPLLPDSHVWLLRVGIRLPPGSEPRLTYWVWAWANFLISFASVSPSIEWG